MVSHHHDKTKALLEAAKPPIIGVAGRAVATAVLSSFLFGYSICVLNSCMDFIAVDLAWCGNDFQVGCTRSITLQGFVNASLYLGAAAGSWLLGTSRFCTWTSRAHLLLSDFFFVAGSLCCMLASCAAPLVVGRFLSGVGMGIAGIAAPVFISEVSPKERRGRFCCLHGTFISIGLLAASAFGLPQGPPPSGVAQPLEGLDVWYWRFLLGFAAIPALLQSLVFGKLWPIEPPSQLVKCGRMEEARAVMFRIHDLEPPTEGAVTNLAETKMAAQLEMELMDLAAAATAAKSVRPIWITQALADPFFKCALWLGFFLAALSQLCGINALMSYSNSFFQQGGIAPENLTWASTLMCVVNVFVSFLTSLSVDRWGRRTLLLLGTSLMAIAMLLLCLGKDGAGSLIPPEYLGMLTVSCFTLFTVSFGGGLGAITWLYLSEIYPMEIRSAALSACGIINWVCSFTVVFGGRFLTLHESIKVFGLVTTLGALGIYFWVVETKGCSMDDSPLTPRSERSNSSLLTPTTADYDRLGDGEDSEEETDV
jgi:SP family sugar:H+ symporter-like MFS transporter